MSLCSDVTVSDDWSERWLWLAVLCISVVLLLGLVSAINHLHAFLCTLTLHDLKQLSFRPLAGNGNSSAHRYCCHIFVVASRAHFPHLAGFPARLVCQYLGPDAPFITAKSVRYLVSLLNIAFDAFETLLLARNEVTVDCDCWFSVWRAQLVLERVIILARTQPWGSTQPGRPLRIDAVSTGISWED